MHHGHVIADTWVLIPGTGHMPGSNNIDIHVGIVIVHNMHDIVYRLKSIVPRFSGIMTFFYLKAQSNPWNPENVPLQQVISNHFVNTTITSSCAAEDFQRKYDLRTNTFNIFVECTNQQIIKDCRDVMLMDKVM